MRERENRSRWRPIHRPRTPRSRASLLVVVLLAGALQVGCGQTDPVEAIRDQIARGEVDSAVEALRGLIRERPDEPELLLLYGQALAAAGEPGLAEWPLRKAMRHPEWTVPAGLEVAYLAIRTLNFSTAIDVLDEVLRLEPDNLDGLILRANAHAQSKFHAEAALEDVARLRELDPDNAESFKPEILSLLVLERIDEANAALENLGERIEQGGGDEVTRAWYCTTMALFAYESGELDLAETRWNDCVEQYPTDAQIVTEAVDFFDKRHAPDRALEILRRAVEESDLSARDFRVLLAQRLNSMGQEKEAEALLREGAESPNPQLATIYGFDLARFFDANGRPTEALEAGEQALVHSQRLGQPHASQLFEVADLSIRAGKLDRALLLADEIPVEPYSELVRARVAQERSEHRSALAHFDAAAVLWPDNSFARYHAARSAEALGEFDRALELYRHATRISMEATDSQTRIARIQLAQGASSAALATLKTHRDRGLLEPEGELLLLRLQARLLLGEKPSALWANFMSRHPEQGARAVEAIVTGLREGGRGELAFEIFRELDPEFLLDPENAEALRAFVLPAAGAPQESDLRDRIGRAVQTSPKSAALREVQGLLLEMVDENAEAAGEAYAEALALDPKQAHALARLGRLIARQDPDRAQGLLERALAVERPDFDPIREGAVELLQNGRPDAGRQILGELLERVPYDGQTAEALCRNLLLAGEVTDQVVDLARRAARFDANDRTRALLGQVRGLQAGRGATSEPRTSEGERGGAHPGAG